MSSFGSELRYHPKLKDVKFRLFVPFMKLFYQVFGLFGFFAGGEYLRGLYFRKTLNKYKFEFNTVLDAGCGYGYYSFYLARKYPTATIEACDSDADHINENKYIQHQLKLTNLLFLKVDLGKLSERNKYDMAISVDVLELIEDDLKVVKNISDALKKGGYFLLHTPKRNQQDTSGSWKVRCPDRVREGYSWEEISQLLESNGFEIIKKVNTFGVFGVIGLKMHSLLPTRYLKRMFAIPINCINFLDTLTQHKNGQAFLLIAKKKL